MQKVSLEQDILNVHTESDDINAPLLDFKFLNLLKL